MFLLVLLDVPRRDSLIKNLWFPLSYKTTLLKLKEKRVNFEIYFSHFLQVPKHSDNFQC